MNATELFEEFSRRGVQLRIETGSIIARPLSAVSPDLRRAAAEHKRELIEAIVADEALRLLSRLKTFTLPRGRIPAAREIAQHYAARLLRREDGKSLLDSGNPQRILAVLHEIERELIALGGSPDLELAEAVAMVQRSFPGARLVEVRKPRR